jgi:phospho-N-acetylmuramoyl-pentapeptide-transferase
MDQILFLTLLSFGVISIFLVPFINLLYSLKLQRQIQKTRDIFSSLTPIFDKLHGGKVGTPVGGGALIILIVTVLFLAVVEVGKALEWEYTSIYQLESEIFVLLFTFASFGVLGLVDDIRKTFGYERKGFWGLGFRLKFLLQLILAFGISLMLYYGLGIDLVNVRFIDIFHLSWLYIPFSTFVIVAFANAVNISDGLDGLASGLLVICLFALLVLSRSILDSTLSIFIGLWIGALFAFLYFNVYPARIWLGDVGSLSFGATLAVAGLILGKPIALAIIGGVFVVEAASSLLQLLSKKLRGKKLFEVAPLHLYFQNKGWPEPKVVTRFWLAGAMFALFGLWLGLI